MRGRWLALGLILGMLVVPATAFGIHKVTKGKPVTIYRKSGNAAEITLANQLRSAEADPRHFAFFYAPSAGGCRPDVPLGRLLGRRVEARAFTLTQPTRRRRPSSGGECLRTARAGLANIPGRFPQKQGQTSGLSLKQRRH